MYRYPSGANSVGGGDVAGERGRKVEERGRKVERGDGEAGEGVSRTRDSTDDLTSLEDTCYWAQALYVPPPHHAFLPSSPSPFFISLFSCTLPRSYALYLRHLNPD
ncbi:hypothetical protein Pmani_036038 [Petrolisthes manimaculis]|uniref:Uncharacterized protein n=1 Tax=Petrolisthes manimaculis TaxID=1843537 RepID=A0AAE1TPT3_9EUCA|nr:hypothetical protein Pmani_036038 [Petrolisthes manimaculis]